MKRTVIEYPLLGGEVSNRRFPPGWIEVDRRLEEIGVLLHRVREIAWRDPLTRARSNRRIARALQTCAQEYRFPKPAPADALEWWQERLVRAWQSVSDVGRVLASTAYVASFHLDIALIMVEALDGAEPEEEVVAQLVALAAIAVSTASELEEARRRWQQQIAERRAASSPPAAGG